MNKSSVKTGAIMRNSALSTALIDIEDSGPNSLKALMHKCVTTSE